MKSNYNNLKNAVFEANRFIARANELIDAEEAKNESYYMTPKESGAARRASLDLTRALAAFRKDYKG
jgi:hypothetical protein